MTSPDREYLRTVEAENRRMREAIQSLNGWIEHWQIDVISDLQPTIESLISAHGVCRRALSREFVS